VRLEGIHHITAITGDAPANVDFYARILGLRLVKKTVNQDDPTVYHLFYADENASAGADLTFFEYPGLPSGSPGAGMVHRIAHRVASHEAIDYWRGRFADEGVTARSEGEGLVFADREGLEHELVVVETDDRPLIARSALVPDEYALQGFDHVRAFTDEPARSERLLTEVLGFEAAEGDAFEARGERRGGRILYDRSSTRGRQGAGTVHHVAWAAPPEDIESWQDRVARSGARPTPVIDRFYFRSVYFREPSGVLFELATLGPGFTVDEPAETLGEALSLPPNYESYRERVSEVLTPLPDTRQWRRATARAS
jgi:glyoxalase family protein